MLADLRKSFDQAFDPEFCWLMVSGIAVALVMLSIGTVLVYWSATFVQDLGVRRFGAILNQLLSSNVVATMFGLSVVLMLPVAAVQLELFRERVARRVEIAYYPAVPQPDDGGSPQAFSSLRILFVLLLANIALGALFLVLPTAALALFWVVNGFLLGREYFFMIALRHQGPMQAIAQRDQHRWQIFVIGVLMALALSVPVMNLMVPMIGMAVFTHMVRRLNPVHDGYLSRLDEHRQGYFDRNAAGKVQESLANHEAPVAIAIPAAKVQAAPLTGAPMPSAEREVDPDDPTTWNNIFSDLACVQTVKS